MWKTTLETWTWKQDDGVLALCPQCDAVGPHRIDAQGVACIDCGEMLGRLSPEGVEPFEEAPEPVKGPGLEPIQAGGTLQRVLREARVEQARRSRQTAAWLGFAV
jgi:hypothetical protein